MIYTFAIFMLTATTNLTFIGSNFQDAVCVKCDCFEVENGIKPFLSYLSYLVKDVLSQIWTANHVRL